MAEKNQTPAEEKQLARTGKKGLELAVQKMGPEIMKIAAPDVAKAGSVWFQRAIVSVAGNDALKEVLQSDGGILSVIKAFQKAAVMGLQIGGQFPQAHLTPYDGKVELIVSAEGYKHAAVHGPGAVLSDCVFRRVYDGEQFSIDFARAEVTHNYDGKSDRGKLVGIYGVMTRSDGAKAVDYMTRIEALLIRDAHSRAYKNGKGPWKTDEDPMIEKTAAKKFLRKYAAEAEGLAMLFAQDTDEPETMEPPPHDVSDRMAARLDRQAERATVAEPVKKEDEPIKSTAEVMPDAPAGGAELF